MASARDIHGSNTHGGEGAGEAERARAKPDKQDILFMSARCKWCAEALSIARRIGSGGFLVVDVDKPNVVTPPFLDRVPMLLTASSRVYADDELFRLLRSRVPVDPFMVNEMHGLSDAYSYIGQDGDGGDDGGIRHAYNFLGGQEEPLVSTQDSSHDRIVNYEKFVQERDTDLNKILKDH